MNTVTVTVHHHRDHFILGTDHNEYEVIILLLLLLLLLVLVLVLILISAEFVFFGEFIFSQDFD